MGTCIVANARRSRFRRAVGLTLSLAAALALVGCYPRYDWRDVRPDCAKFWCGFVATFPGKLRSATRDVPVGAVKLPLTVHVVSIGYVSFAVTVFDLPAGGDVVGAREVLERKLLEDVGAPVARRGRTELRAADGTVLAADTFEADGTVANEREHAQARFVERRGHLIEILVVGPLSELGEPAGRQAIETFFTSLRVD